MAARRPSARWRDNRKTFANFHFYHPVKWPPPLPASFQSIQPARRMAAISPFCIVNVGIIKVFRRNHLDQSPISREHERLTARSGAAFMANNDIVDVFDLWYRGSPRLLSCRRRLLVLRIFDVAVTYSAAAADAFFDPRGLNEIRRNDTDKFQCKKVIYMPPEVAFVFGFYAFIDFFFRLPSTSCNRGDVKCRFL